MIINTTLKANQAQEYTERADFFRLLDSTGPVEVRFYANGAEVARAEDVTEGYAEKFDAGEFDKIRISATANTTVHFVTRLGNVVNYDKPPTGDVNVLNFPAATAVNGAFTHSVVAVATSNVQLLPAKANRRYLMIQNNDSVVDVWVRVDGVAATLGAGVKLVAGGTSLELQGYVPTGAVNAIGIGGSTANIQIVEG
jgi:hypothetical protein